MAKRGKNTAREDLLQAFPVEYIKHGLNGTRAYKALKPNVTDKSAAVYATHLLKESSVRERILALLPSEEVEAGVIREALTEKPKKAITWQDKHKYLETSLKLKGLLANTEDKTSVQVGIIIEREK